MSAIDVKLNVFEGPLDLLLHLIEKNKVNIYDIPIVTITEQYLEYVNNMEEEDLDVMSEFLVMAATLIKIKSKMLLPKDEEDPEDEEDPREELVRRLLEYKMYKYAAGELKDLEIEGNKAFFKKATIPAEVKNVKQEVDPYELISKADVDLQKLKEIEREEISLEEKMAEVREEVRGLEGINFRTLLEMQASKMNIIVTFLAILELMKIGAIAIRQEDIFGEIIIDSLDTI